MAERENTRTTKHYDWTGDESTIDEVERNAIQPTVAHGQISPAAPGLRLGSAVPGSAMYLDQSLPAITVTRADLFEQVWARPMVKVAADYRVSATALVKACRKAEIPVPPQGYWNKLQFGKPVPKQPSLPAVSQGQPASITIQPSNPPPGMDPVVDERAAEEKRPENRIQVQEQLRHPHTVVQDVVAALSKAPRDDRGMHSTKDLPSVLTVRVSPALKVRALRILDAFVKSLETRGFAVTGEGVLIEGHRVPLSMEEKADRSPHTISSKELAESRGYFGRKPPMWDYFPSGILCLYTDAYVWWRKDLRKRWSEGRTTKLEDMLNDIVVDIVAIGVALRQRADDKRKEEERRAEEERRRLEKVRQARLETARRKLLLESSAAWGQSAQLREFLIEIERRIAAGEEAATEAIRQWQLWAEQIAAALDPLSEGLSEYLEKQARAAGKAADTEPHTPYRSTY